MVSSLVNTIRKGMFGFTQVQFNKDYNELHLWELCTSLQKLHNQRQTLHNQRHNNITDIWYAHNVGGPINTFLVEYLDYDFKVSEYKFGSFNDSMQSYVYIFDTIVIKIELMKDISDHRLANAIIKSELEIYKNGFDIFIDYYYYNFFFYNNKFYKLMIMKYYKNGNLHEYIRAACNADRQECEMLISNFNAKIQKIIDHLVEYNMIYLDFKPENVIVDDDKTLKIIDFSDAWCIDTCYKEYNICSITKVDKKFNCEVKYKNFINFIYHIRYYFRLIMNIVEKNPYIPNFFNDKMLYYINNNDGVLKLILDEFNQLCTDTLMIKQFSLFLQYPPFCIPPYNDYFDVKLIINHFINFIIGYKESISYLFFTSPVHIILLYYIYLDKIIGITLTNVNTREVLYLQNRTMWRTQKKQLELKDYFFIIIKNLHRNINTKENVRRIFVNFYNQQSKEKYLKYKIKYLNLKK